MKHLSNLSQNVRVFMAVVALSVGAAGCASGSDGTGTAGSSGTAGGGGTAGSTGACTLDDVNKIFVSPAGQITGCTVAGTCHDANGTAAGFNMTSPGWQTKLVGMSPVAGAGTATGFPTMCAGMGPFLVAGSNPAKGLFLDKIDPTTSTAPCGLHMPELQASLTAQQFSCIKSWATTLTNP
jgi:hypothetical protein